MAKLKINILDDGDYLKLHMKHNVSKEDLEDSLGFSDPDTGEAFIRQTGVSDIDEATILHEIDELTSSQSYHEDANGYRWKKWGKPFRALTGTGASQKGTIFGNVLPTVANIGLGAVPGIGPALATGYGAWQGATHGGGVKGGLLGALQGYGLGNVGEAVKGGVQGAMEGTGILKGASEGLSRYGLNPMISKALGFGGAGTTGTTSGLGTTGSGLAGPVTEAQSKLGYNYLSQVPTNLVGSAAAQAALNAGMKPVTLPSAPTAPATQTPTTQVPNITDLKAEGYTPPVGVAAQGVAKSGLGSLAGTLASPAIQTGVGLLTTGASALPKNAEFENVSSLEQLRNEIATKGSSPALYMRARRSLEEGYTDAREELDTIYNQAGMLDSGEYRDAVAKLATKKADAEELLSAQIDEQTMNDLLGLTNLDVQIAAAKYGADAADITALRQILGTAGGTMLSSGLKGLGVTQ